MYYSDLGFYKKRAENKRQDYRNIHDFYKRVSAVGYNKALSERSKYLQIKGIIKDSRNALKDFSASLESNLYTYNQMRWIVLDILERLKSRWALRIRHPKLYRRAVADCRQVLDLRDSAVYDKYNDISSISGPYAFYSYKKPLIAPKNNAEYLKAVDAECTSITPIDDIDIHMYVSTFVGSVIKQVIRSHSDYKGAKIAYKNAKKN